MAKKSEMIYSLHFELKYKKLANIIAKCMHDFVSHDYAS